MEIKVSYDTMTMLKLLELVSGITPGEAVARALSIGLRAVVEEAQSAKPWQNGRPVKYWEKAFSHLEQLPTEIRPRFYGPLPGCSAPPGWPPDNDIKWTPDDFPDPTAEDRRTRTEDRPPS